MFTLRRLKPVDKQFQRIALCRRELPGVRGLIGLSFLQQFKYSVDSRTQELLLEN